jgi:phosphoribosyl 1,2-cyclic phosphodiesterase
LVFFAATMSLFIASLNSGSNGNCYYVGNGSEAVLIDAGLSCRETEKRMNALGLSMKKVRAIFVSHEHSDHIKGVSTLANKYSLPVYITPATAKHGPILIKHLSRPFAANEPVAVGELSILPFTKKHDASDPHSFLITGCGVTVGVFTDIGKACNQVTRHFKKCHAAFLESNYDEEMLENGSYPLPLKNRIRGGEGHLSNRQALELFLRHRPPFMTHLLLSHLSKENNSPQLAASVFANHAKETKILVATREKATEVICINSPDSARKKKVVPTPALQMGLFD